MTYTRSLLSNGLRLITIPMPSFESATVLVMVGAGSRYENKNNSGISHFLEHMAFKGTEKRPTAMDISSIIDGMGGEFNAFTGKETTGYYIKSAKSNIETSIDILSDMLMHSKLDPAEIEKEKGVIIEEINLYEDMPMRKIGDVYESLLYGDVPMGWDIAGNKDVIMKITRDDFKSYMGSLYSAHNMTVVIAGGIDEAGTKSLVEKYFNPMGKFDITSYAAVKEQQEEPNVLVKEKVTEQAHLALGIRTVDGDNPEKYPLEVLASILGGGMSSRLFHEIREKRGLAYYVRTHSDHYKDVGSLVSMAGVDPKRINDSIKVIVEEYAKAKNGELKITEEELKKAKEYLKGHLVLELEDSRSVASYYAHQELLEKEISNPADEMKKLDEVSVETINEVGKNYFKNETLNLAVIGNFGDGQQFAPLLKI